MLKAKELKQQWMKGVRGERARLVFNPDFHKDKPKSGAVAGSWVSF